MVGSSYERAPLKQVFDLASLAGLTPAAVFAEVLDSQGEMANAEALVEFCRSP